MDAQLPDISWIFFCGVLVFGMQGGFLFLESGLTRAKNSINVATKNFADFLVAVALYWSLGFALMFGTSVGGWVGSSGFFFGQGASPFHIAFFFFQAMFCATAATIISGAVAERMRFWGYVVITLIVSAFVYPTFGHWAWNEAEKGLALGWLGARGFVDFAGSTAVHSLGGWAALAAVIVIGPRNGRFPENGPPRQLPASNLPAAMLGGLLLWFGWFGFNGGSTFALNAQVPGIISNTLMAGIAGGMAVFVAGWFRYGIPKVRSLVNGTLAGLVSITASSDAVTMPSSVLIGAIGGLCILAMDALLERLRIDDAIGAAPVHLAAGIWGTIAVALLGNPERLGTGLDRWEQFAVQIQGIVACFVIAFGSVYLVLSIINRIWPMRVSESDEEIGLNVSEHDEKTELIDLLRGIEDQAASQDLSIRVAEEPFTEIGLIAKYYNRAMDALQVAVATTKAVVDSALDGIITINEQDVVEMANPAVANIFGHPLNEIIGGNVRVLIPEAFRSEHIGTGRETHGRKRDGATFPLYLAVSDMFVGERRMRVGVVRDISEQKRIEATLQTARAEAEEASQVKSDFISRMSHEIRTPMNAIVGMAYLALKTTLTAKQRDYITKINSAGDSLLSIIDDVLDFSKIEAGKLPMERIGFRFDDVLENVSVVVGQKARDKGLEFVFSTADVPQHLWGSTTLEPSAHQPHW